MTNLFHLQLTDWEKALLVAVLTSPITVIYQSLLSGSFDLDWKQLLAGAIAGGLGYLLKNFFTNSQGQFLTTEPTVSLNGTILGGGKFLGVFELKDK